jgi:protein-S-isoprenylcysteine O-methyltransferase Ste14
LTTGARAPGSRLPDLGPRGEGWVVAQVILIGLIFVAGLTGIRNPWPTSVIGWGASIAGLACMLLGASVVGRAVHDLGASLTPVPRPHPGASLVVTGVYRRIRHPIYAGLMLGAVGWSGLTRSLAALVVALLLIAILDAKARREEQWLMERYDGYADYRRRSKRFMPGVY